MAAHRHSASSRRAAATTWPAASTCRSTRWPACRSPLGETTHPFDVGSARGEDGSQRYFGAAGGVGFDAAVAYTMAVHRRFWMRGEAGYFLGTLNELRRYRNSELRVTLIGDGEDRVVSQRFLFVAFANGPYYGGGMQICPDAETDDGWLDVCLVGDLSRLAALRELPGIYQAKHLKNPKVEIVRARTRADRGRRDHPRPPGRGAVRHRPGRDHAPPRGGQRGGRPSGADAVTEQPAAPEIKRRRTAARRARPAHRAGGRRLRGLPAGAERAASCRSTCTCRVTRSSRTDGKLRVELDRRAAYDAWHRPLKRAPHGER